MHMADTQQTGATAGGKQLADFTIPDSVRTQFAEIIGLIMQSESMNDEERQYWFDILPVMNGEQVENLKTILVNERTQLAAIDAKYAPKAGDAPVDVVKIGEQRRANREELRSQESATRQDEEAASEELLKKMDTL